jgi:hypothetical protein
VLGPLLKGDLYYVKDPTDLDPNFPSPENEVTFRFLNVFLKSTSKLIMAKTSTMVLRSYHFQKPVERYL